MIRLFILMTLVSCGPAVSVHRMDQRAGQEAYYRCSKTPQIYDWKTTRVSFECQSHGNEKKAEELCMELCGVSNGK